jgi:hypothetical protein
MLEPVAQLNHGVILASGFSLPWYAAAPLDALAWLVVHPWRALAVATLLGIGGWALGLSVRQHRRARRTRLAARQAALRAPERAVRRRRR